MRISYSTAPGNLQTTNGYGVAGLEIVRSLQRLGHEVPYRSRAAPVQINFSQPTWYDFGSKQYKIGYTPWESTLVPEGWRSHIEDVDELWTTSDLIAKWYREQDLHDNIRVYPHGIDPIYKTVATRGNDYKLKFLHVGHPSARKGGITTINAFKNVFGDRKDVSLTVKVQAGRDKLTGHEQGNINFVVGNLKREQLPSFYKEYDVLVYPTWGEGFGLIPLEALATGMPVVATANVLPYEDWVVPVDSKLVESPWPDMHPGKMYEPDYDDLCVQMKHVHDNMDHYGTLHSTVAPEIWAAYDWDSLTYSAFDHIVKKFSV